MSAPTFPNGSAGSSRSASTSTRRSSSPSSGTTSCRRRRRFAIYLVGGYFAITGQMGRRCRGRRAARLQGPAVADQGADRLGPAAPGRADQVRAGDRPVPARRHDAAGAAGDPRWAATAARQGAGAGRRGGFRGRAGQAARQRFAHPADHEPRGGDRRLGLGQGSPGLCAGAPDAAQQRLDTHRRQGFLPAAGVRHRLAPGLCRPGHLPVPAVGPRQPAVRPQDPAGTASHLRRGDQGVARILLEGVGAGPGIRHSIPMPTGSTTSWRAPPARPTCCPAWCGC